MGGVPAPDPHARPRQVTMAGWVTIIGSALVIASVFAQIGALDSLDTRRGVEETLAQPPLDGLDLQVSEVLEAIRVLAMVTGACAAATAILGWQVMQRSRSARLALSILAVPMFLAGLVAGGFTTSLVAAAAVILWLQPARAWLNGDPVPERFLRPPGDARREQDAARGRDGGRPDPFAPTPPAAPTEDRGQAPSWPPPTGSPVGDGPAPASTGPAAYPGFGQRPAGVDQPVGTSEQPGQPGAWPVPSGQPGAWGPPVPAQRGPKPNPLRAGLVLTWITCALVVVGLVLVVVAIALDPALVDEEIERAIAQNPTTAGEITVDQVRVAVYAFLAGFVAWALAAALVASFAWTGRTWAWVLLCVSAGLSAGLFLLLSLLGAFIALIPLAMASGALALLLRPEVRAWYAAR
ncbi:hypothetical protein GCM10027270_08450 [Nocardioides ginkgobilobae]